MATSLCKLIVDQAKTLESALIPFFYSYVDVNPWAKFVICPLNIYTESEIPELNPPFCPAWIAAVKSSVS